MRQAASEEDVKARAHAEVYTSDGQNSLNPAHSVSRERESGVKRFCLCVKRGAEMIRSPYGEEVVEDLARRWNGAGSEKAVGVRNPHRCEVSRKQSPGFMLPAGDGCQH